MKPLWRLSLWYHWRRCAFPIDLYKIEWQSWSSVDTHGGCTSCITLLLGSRNFDSSFWSSWDFTVINETQKLQSLWYVISLVIDLKGQSSSHFHHKLTEYQNNPSIIPASRPSNMAHLTSICHAQIQIHSLIPWSYNLPLSFTRSSSFFFVQALSACFHCTSHSFAT